MGLAASTKHPAFPSDPRNSEYMSSQAHGGDRPDSLPALKKKRERENRPQNGATWAKPTRESVPNLTQECASASRPGISWSAVLGSLPDRPLPCPKERHRDGLILPSPSACKNLPFRPAPWRSFLLYLLHRVEDSLKSQIILNYISTVL